MTENIKIASKINGSTITTTLPTNTIQEVAAQNSSSLTDSTAGILQSSTPMTNTSAPDVVSDDSLRFILIPLGVFLGIIILSSLVFLMARNRRRLAHIYCKHRMRRSVSRQIFDDDSDEALEQGEDYDDDENDPTECLLKGKLQIDNSYETYKTTQRNDAYA